MEEVRFPAVAGTFYPSDETSLITDLDSYIKPLNDKEKKVKALIVPHAGYIYSGSIAGEGYSRINGCKYDEVIILGVSHSSIIEGVAVANYKEWETPLGKISQSKKSEEIVKNDDEQNLIFFTMIMNLMNLNIPSKCKCHFYSEQSKNFQ